MPGITLCADSYGCKNKKECSRSLENNAGEHNAWQSMSWLYQRWKHEKTDECEYYEPMED